MTTHSSDETDRITIGIPIGALVFRRVEDLQPFRTLLEHHLGPIRFRGVEPYYRWVNDPGSPLPPNSHVLVHLPPIVADILSALHDHDDDRDLERLNQCQQLAAYLRSKGAIYLAGVRRKLNLPEPITTVPETLVPRGSNRSFTFVELFAGIGGFRLGLEALGGKCVLANELSKNACKMYQSYFLDPKNKNAASQLVHGDVLDLDLTHFSPFTMLTAGFPCQPFSNRGHQRGLDDQRSGQMYLELSRILAETQPPCFLFENVPQLLLLDGGNRSPRRKGEPGTFVAGNVMKRICQSFASCGYHVDWAVINSRHFVPQNRERVYFVGIRKDFTTDALVGWKDRALSNTSSLMTVRSILEPDDSTAVEASELTECQWAKVQSMYKSKGQNALVDASIDLDAKAPTLISQYHRVGSLSTKFVCHNSDGTVRDGLSGRPRPRFFTLRECCRLMGFPESFPIVPNNASHLYQGLGNAVTPPVITAIGRELLQSIKGVGTSTLAS